MKQVLLFFPTLLLPAALGAGLTEQSIGKYVDTLALSKPFCPVKEGYWTRLPRHRRTPFAVSPDGTVAYIAYLDASQTDVHVQAVNPVTFEATGLTVTVPGCKEAGGLVAHNDGFALLTNEVLPLGVANAPPSSTPVAVLYRFAACGTQKWKTFLGGPDVGGNEGLVASPDLNGDLVYSEVAKLYAAYFVVTAYSGGAAGHFGDAIQYVDVSGALQRIPGATSTWGCSHNTGIAFEAADEAPFASICAEDQGAIWLNTKGQGMSTVGVKISNENTTNGASNEPMNGMSGSYSALVRMGDSPKYMFAWVSRGAMDLSLNEWMGPGYTHSVNRTNGRNVAIAIFSDKYTMVGNQATSEVGAASGDDHINWITNDGTDCSNVHAAAFNADFGIVTWEEAADPVCEFTAMGCRGVFTGSVFQAVSSDGAKLGGVVRLTDTYVTGDMVTIKDGRICWPYVNMKWNLNEPVGYEGSTETSRKMSFACASLAG